MKKIIAFCFITILFLSCGSTPKVPKSKLILPDGVSIRDTERGKVLVANNKVIFAFGKSYLPRNARGVLKNTVKYILDKNPNVKIILESHTSNKGIAYPYNYNLSTRRTSVGKKYLNSIGATDKRVIGKSYGESLPEYPTQKALRRYEFVIIENDADLKKYNDFFKTINPRTETTFESYNKK